MGQLINGKWENDASAIELVKARFVRQASTFRQTVGPGGPFPAEVGRYHLYVSLQCPWAWRTIAIRSLKRLEPIISMSVAIPNGRREGWVFGNDFPGATADEAEGYIHLYEAYMHAQADYTGIASVPVLWDKKTHTIVNNESAEILRILNSSFSAFADSGLDFYPPSLRPQIEAYNERIYTGLNNGVYRAGVAATQEAYEEAYGAIFDTLDWLEDLLGKSRYVNGSALTETDIRLAASLFRFDPVYYSLFRCNKRTVASYENLTAYLRDIYQTPGIAKSVNLKHIMTGYYSQKWNPGGIIPLGPEGYENWLAQPHGRARAFS